MEVTMFEKIKDGLNSANFHWRDLAYILVIGASLMWLTGQVQQYRRDTAPASDYFVVNQIGIPNFTLGENPVVLYDREVKQAFSGSFTAEIQDAANLNVICPSTKTFNYDPAKQLPREGVTLSWLMYREPLPDCKPPVGTYRVEICWTINRIDAVPVRMCEHSNTFSVREMELK
jgi:hypothetical protein